MQHRITLIAIATVATSLVATPLLAQQDTTHGGVNGAARQVSAASKTAGRSAKADVKSVGSSVHHVLKDAGRGTKAALAKAVGHTKPAPGHKPGGLNKVARDVSESVKHVGRSAKASVHTGASHAHKVLQKTGNDVKHANADTTRP